MMKKVIHPKLFLTTITLSILASQLVRAGDDFDKILLLAENVRDVVTFGEEKPDFKLNAQQSDKMVALASMDNTTFDFLEASKAYNDCINEKKARVELQARIDKRDFQIEGLVLSNNLHYEQNVLGRFMNDDYMIFLSQEFDRGNIKSKEINSVDNLEKKYLQMNPNTKLDTMTLNQKEKTLSDFAESFLGTKLPAGLLMKEMAFQTMMNRPGDWKATLAEAKDKLSIDQRIQLVSKLGGYFGNNYNYDRLNGGKSESGKFVSTKELLTSIKNGTPGGVCRDIALAQTQFLDALGFKDNYVVSYKTVDASHATVITTDPVTKKIIKFNYDETTQLKAGSGTEALTQQTSIPDFGINYRVYDSQGKPVTKFSSELGLMLKDATGASTERSFDDKNYSIAKVGFNSGTINGNIFAGKTSNGLNLYGVSVYQNTATEHVKSSVGVAVSKLSGERSNIKIDQSSLFLRAATEVNSSSIKIGPVQSSVFGGLSGEMMVANNSQSKVDSNRTTVAKKQIEASAEFYAGVENKIESADKKTYIDNKVYATFYPEFNHVAAAGKTVPVLNYVVVQTGVGHELTDDIRAKLDTAVVMRNYGTSIVVKAMLEDDKRNLRASAGVSTPITKDMPSYLPGASTRATASVDYVTPRVMFSIEVERDLNNKSTSVGAKARGNF